MSPAQQKVYRLAKQEGFQSIAPHTEPIPSPTKLEVLLKIKALSLNFRDLAIAKGTYPFPVKPDVVPISDCSAEVLEVREGVSEVETGDRVIVTFDPTNLYGPQKDWNNGYGGPKDGFLCEYAVVPASAVVRIPKESTMGWPQLASLVCTGTTVWNALFGPVSVRPGQVVLVQGECASRIKIYADLLQAPAASP
jgi:NADPH:quinone reductase-like Zn-dependent oxidoreductase